MCFVGSVVRVAMSEKVREPGSHTARFPPGSRVALLRQDHASRTVRSPDIYIIWETIRSRSILAFLYFPPYLLSFKQHPTRLFSQHV